MSGSMRCTATQALFVCIISLIGCGDGRPARVPVAGKVSIDGQPLTYGVVRFVPNGARVSSGRINSDGTFKLGCFEQDDGAVTGQHRVEVSGAEVLGDTKTRWHAPKKYSNYTNSGLTQEISGPVDSLEIKLSWDGGKTFMEVIEGDEEERGPRKRAK